MAPRSSHRRVGAFGDRSGLVTFEEECAARVVALGNGKKSDVVPILSEVLSDDRPSSCAGERIKVLITGDTTVVRSDHGGPTTGLMLRGHSHPALMQAWVEKIH